MRKKTFLTLLSLSSLLLMSSCNKDDVEPGTLIQSEPYRVLNIVGSSDGEASASMALYRVNFSLLAGDATVQCSDLPVGKSLISFETSSVPFSSWQEQNQYSVTTITTTGHVPMSSAGVKIENMNFYITSAINDFTGNQYAAPGVSNQYLNKVACFIQYDLNSDYKVKATPADVSFNGSTVTSYPSAEGIQSYENSAIKYRVVFDVAQNKADVVLYDAQFAPAPSPSLKGLVLRGLDVEFTEDAGYVVSGENIIPEVLEGPSSATPNPKFSFNSFELRSSSADLTKVECDYTVATVFKGTFKGSALLTSK